MVSYFGACPIVALFIAVGLGFSYRFNVGLEVFGDWGVWPRYMRGAVAVGAQELGLLAHLSTQARVVDVVLSKATQGDPESVLKAVDDYGWTGNLMINIGDRKGVHLDKAVRDRAPQLAVELGTYIGYSAVRIARLLPPGGHLISVDPSPLAHATATVLLKLAGLDDRVTLAYDYSDAVLKRLSAEGKQIDFLFVDHLKWLYLPDLQLAESLGLLQKGSVVVGDNIIFPGAPDFKAYVLNASRFSTEVFESTVEYTNLRDEVTVSVCKR